VEAKYLKWIEENDPEMLVPTFTFSGEGVEVDGKKVESGKTELDFSEPIILSVVDKDGKKSDYCVSLNCPQINKELPVLRMQPEKEITSQDYYVPTTITLYSPDTEKGWWLPENGKIEVRGRGNSTWILPKKPYRIKFPEKFSPIGLEHAKAKSWVLLANDMDKSLIRDALGWEMSRIMFDSAEKYHDEQAVLFTPCVQYINIYMNDDYHGLYLLTDQLERAKGRMAVDKLNAADGAYPEKIKGGYMIETNFHDEPAPKRFHSPRGANLDHRYPDSEDFDPAQYAYIENLVTEAENVLFSDNFKDKSKGWRKYYDEKTLADFIIVKELCGDMDAYTSTYFYKRRGSDKLFFGPIWDVDKGWDNEVRTAGYTDDKANNLMIHAGFQMPPCNFKDWFNRFWEDETFRSFVNERWKSRRDKLVSTVKSRAKEIPAAMPNAIKANFTKWEFYYQASTEAKIPAKTYELEIERIISLTDQRAATLDKLFAQ